MRRTLIPPLGHIPLRRAGGNHARNYWLFLAEEHLIRRLFGVMAQ